MKKNLLDNQNISLTDARNTLSRGSQKQPEGSKIFGARIWNPLAFPLYPTLVMPGGSSFHTMFGTPWLLLEPTEGGASGFKVVLYWPY